MLTASDIPYEGLALAGFQKNQLRGQPGNAGRWVKPEDQATTDSAGSKKQRTIHDEFLRTVVRNRTDIIGETRHGWQVYTFDSNGRVVAFSPDGTRRINFDHIDLARHNLDILSMEGEDFDRWGIDKAAKLDAMQRHLKADIRMFNYAGATYQFREDMGKDPWVTILPDGGMYRAESLDAAKEKINSYHEVRVNNAVGAGGGMRIADTYRGHNIMASPEGRYEMNIEGVRTRAPSIESARMFLDSHAATLDRARAAASTPDANGVREYRGGVIQPATGGGFYATVPGHRGPTWNSTIQNAKARIDDIRAQIPVHAETRPPEAERYRGVNITPGEDGRYQIAIPGRSQPANASTLEAARARVDLHHNSIGGTFQPGTSAFETPPAAKAEPKYKEPSWDDANTRERGDNVAFDGPTLVNGKRVLVRNPKGLTSKKIQEEVGRKDFTVKKMVELTAPREGATVTVNGIIQHDKLDGSGYESAVSVSVQHEDYHATRTIHPNYIYNNIFEKTTAGHRKGSALSALGVDVVSDQVGTATRMGGFKCLKLTAAGEGNGTHKPSNDGSFGGYNIWAKMGYDGPLRNNPDASYHPELAARIKQQKATVVSQMHKDELSAYLWQKHGKSFTGIFDLSEDSPSRRKLKAYNDYKHKGKPQW